MTKVTAGILAGVVLGAAHGFVSTRGESAAGVIFAAVLGRVSQGIINGILAAHVNRGKTSLWRGVLMGAAIGAGLGVLSGIPGQTWVESIPLGAAVGAGCGAVTSRASG